MGLYDQLIDRTDAAALIPEDVATGIIQGAVANSAVLRKFRRLANMSRAQQRMPVLSALPAAYWVSGDTGLKKTTDQAWGNKYLNVEEIAVLVPIPQAVLDDANYDIWGETQPRLQEAMGVLIDSAVIFGTNKPASWPDDIVTDATAAGNTVSLAAFPDIADAVGADNGLMHEIEVDGFDVNGFLTYKAMKAQFRGLRTAMGDLIYQPSLTVGTPSTLYGETLDFVNNGVWEAAKALMVAGDWSMGVYSIRQDLTFSFSTQAVITDAAGAVIYNLFQQDMVALRAVMRLAVQIANPINREQVVEASRYPFGILTA